MGNFAVKASDALIESGNALLEKLQAPGEKKEDALARVFKIVENQLDTEAMHENGLDTKALDASFDNIKNLFITALGGKEEIISDYENKLRKANERLARAEEDFNEKYNDLKALGAITERREQNARAEYNAMVLERDAAIEAAKKSEALAEKSSHLAELLQDKNKELEGKLNSYNELKASLQELESLNKDLKGKLDEMEKTHQQELMEQERRYSEIITDLKVELAAVSGKVK